MCERDLLWVAGAARPGKGTTMTKTAAPALLLLAFVAMAPACAALTLPIHFRQVPNDYPSYEPPAEVRAVFEDFICPLTRIPGTADCVPFLYCLIYSNDRDSLPVLPSSEGTGVMVGDPAGRFGPFFGVAVLC